MARANQLFIGVANVNRLDYVDDFAWTVAAIFRRGAVHLGQRSIVHAMTKNGGNDGEIRTPSVRRQLESACRCAIKMLREDHAILRGPLANVPSTRNSF